MTPAWMQAGMDLKEEKIKSGSLFWVTLLCTLIMYCMGCRGNAKKNPLNQQSLKRDWLNESGRAFCDVILVLKQRRGLSDVLFPCLLELLLPAFISENNASLIYSLWAWKMKSGTKITCSLRLEEYDTLAWRKRDTLQRGSGTNLSPVCFHHVRVISSVNDQFVIPCLTAIIVANCRLNMTSGASVICGTRCITVPRLHLNQSVSSTSGRLYQYQIQQTGRCHANSSTLIHVGPFLTASLMLTNNNDTLCLNGFRTLQDILPK